MESVYWSYYRKQIYNQCPLRAHRRFDLKDRGLILIEDFEKNALGGSVVHSSIEEWCKEGWKSRFVPENIPGHFSEFDKVIKKWFKRYEIEKKVTYKIRPYEEHFSDVKNHINMFFHFVAKFSIHMGVLYPEVSFNTSKVIEIGGVEYLLKTGGRVDLVFKDRDGDFWVMDWKGTRAEYITDKMNEQLMFYGLGVKAKFGKYPKGLAFLFFNKNALDFIAWTNEEYSKFEKSLVTSGMDFKGGPWGCQPTFECSFCEFVMDCNQVYPAAKNYILRRLNKDKFTSLDEGEVTYFKE